MDKKQYFVIVQHMFANSKWQMFVDLEFPFYAANQHKQSSLLLMKFLMGKLTTLKWNKKLCKSFTFQRKKMDANSNLWKESTLFLALSIMVCFLEAQWQNSKKDSCSKVLLWTMLFIGAKLTLLKKTEHFYEMLGSFSWPRSDQFSSNSLQAWIIQIYAHFFLFQLKLIKLLYQEACVIVTQRRIFKIIFIALVILTKSCDLIITLHSSFLTLNQDPIFLWE